MKYTPLTKEQREAIRNMLDLAYEYGIKSTYSLAKGKQYDKKFQELVNDLMVA